MSDVYNKMLTGAVWMTLLKLVERSIATVSTLILVRLLSPEDFGLVAMCQVFVVAMEIITAFGFEIVLIQKQDAKRVHYDTAWSFKVVFGFLAGVLLIAAAPFIADFYSKSELVLIIQILGLGFFIRSLDNIAIVDFQKHLQFNKLFALKLWVKIIGFAVTIPTAFVLRSYWALIAGVIAANFATLILSYLYKPYLPRLTFKATRSIFSFSSWLLLNNFIFYFRNRLPDLLIGRVIGAHSLGLYTVSREISTVATSELGGAVNHAVFPGYAQFSKSLNELSESVIKVSSTMAFITLPIGFGVIAIAERLVAIALGDAWQNAVPLIQWLSVFGVVGAITSNWIYVFNAMGKPYLITRVGLFQVAILLPLLFWWMDEKGVVGSAIALTVVATLTVPYMLYLMKKLVSFNMLLLGKEIFRPMLGSAMMWIGVTVASPIMPSSGPLAQQILVLLAIVVIGATIYLSTLYLLWISSGKPHNLEHTAVQLVINRLGFHN